MEQPTVMRVSSACCTTGIFSRAAVAQRVAHQAIVEDRLAIVAEGNCPGLLQGRESR